MPQRKLPRRPRRPRRDSHRPSPLGEPMAERPRSHGASRKENRCIVCQDQLTFLRVRYKRAHAHPLCAWLDRMGLDQLAKTSGRWF
jgi:hypothetical protein